MQQKDGFILFMVDEFKQWLGRQTFQRGVRLIQNHHTYKPDYGDFGNDNHFTLLHNMRDYHVNEQKWKDIAQHFTTFPDGTIAVCRSLELHPAGIVGANKNGICIENLGNFDRGKNEMTPEHRNAIIELNVALCQKYHLTPSTDTIVYHHWYNLATGERTGGGTDPQYYKTCPGTNFFGGNSVEAAKANLIPLVKQALDLPQVSGGTGVLKTGVVTASSLNIRNAPSQSGAITWELPQGTAVQVYEEKDGWYRIDPAAQQWVSAKYLQLN